MRLLKTDGEGNVLGEVKTFDPISGIYDAADIARNLAGDGVYYVDTENGKYFEFAIENGQPQGITEEGWREGNPSEAMDNDATAERITKPASEFGGFFFDPEEHGGRPQPEAASDPAAVPPAPAASTAPEDAKSDFGGEFG